MQVLAHNLAAQFTNRQLNITTDQKGKSAEKLSSGYRINRSADDAAGLSISEEMRRQIRGLNKGGTNIQEGISLCQIADGALGEVTSILQRMRQLSIQAYNGTNSKSDRACIQDEIDNCLDGINEIQERTKYNELYVLKNNGRSDIDGIQEVWVDESYTETRHSYQQEIRVTPSWLKTDKKIDYNANNNFTQDITTSGSMPQSYQYTNTKGEETYLYVYYGARDASHPEGYEWIGDVIPDMQQNDKDNYDLLMKACPALADFVKNNFTNKTYTGWTSDSKDNVSCKVDFSGLVDNSNTVDELMTNLNDLLGSELGFPCGTCGKFNAVRFTGQIGNYDIVNYYSSEWNYRSADEISLSENTFECESFYIDDTGKLQKKQMKYTAKEGGYIGAISALHNVEDPVEQNKEVKALAKAIAEDLTKRVKTSLSKSMDNHFDRVTSDNDPSQTMTFYVYDYRDKETLNDQNGTVAKPISNAGRVETHYTYDVTVKDGHYAKIKKGNPSIQIQGSATVGDSIPLELRSMSTASLGLDGYSINSYKREKVYDAEYESKMKAYREAMKNMEYVAVQSEQPYTYLKKAPVYKVESRYIDGEPHTTRTLVSPGEYEKRTRIVTTFEPKYHLTEPQPSTVEVYNPSDLSILDNAMDQVSKMRSYFGASQNRLEHAYAANKNTEENTTAAESRIRDTDMAEEMVGFSKNNILAQVGQSMLAQANQSTQGILSLLQ